MNTLPSSLGGKLEKKEEEKENDLMKVSLHIALLMVLQCADWKRLSQGGVQRSKSIYSLQIVE